MSNSDGFTGTVEALVQAMPVRAAGFIVTLYGDAVVPRGGEIWIGTIIETCALVGISETLVRTAVSRLVAAGQLEGWRRGRRSFYRLSERMQAESEAASRLIYGPPEPWRWRFVHLPEAGADSLMVLLEREGFARLRPQLAVGPARGTLPKGVLVFDADPVAGEALLADFAAQAWDLTAHAAAYDTLVAQFAPLDGIVPDDGAAALTARLLLVHAWRHALLRDPRLPAAALPADWPGRAARTLFQRLYAALSPAADSQIGTRFEGAQGPLPVSTPQIMARLAGRNSEPDQGFYPAAQLAG